MQILVGSHITVAISNEYLAFARKDNTLNNVSATSKFSSPVLFLFSHSNIGLQDDRTGSLHSNPSHHSWKFAACVESQKSMPITAGAVSPAGSSSVNTEAQKENSVLGQQLRSRYTADCLSCDYKHIISQHINYSNYKLFFLYLMC